MFTMVYHSERIQFDLQKKTREFKKCLLFSKTKRIKKRKRIPILKRYLLSENVPQCAKAESEAAFCRKMREQRLAFCFHLFRISRLKGKSRVDDFFVLFVSLSKSKARHFTSFLHFPAIFISLCLEVVLEEYFCFYGVLLVPR